jgi:hypothetical protein
MPWGLKQWGAKGGTDLCKLSWVIPKVGLGADQQVWCLRAVVLDLWRPLFLHILKRRRRNSGEADDKNIGLWVRQWSQAVVVFLPCSVEQPAAPRMLREGTTGFLEIRTNVRVVQLVCASRRAPVKSYEQPSAANKLCEVVCAP